MSLWKGGQTLPLQTQRPAPLIRRDLEREAATAEPGSAVWPEPPPRPPAGRLNAAVVLSVLSLFFCFSSLRLLLFLLMVAGDTVFLSFLSSPRSTRPILRLAGSRRRRSRTQAPGDECGCTNMHFISFFSFPPFAWRACVCSLKGRTRCYFNSLLAGAGLSVHQSPSIPLQRRHRHDSS